MIQKLTLGTVGKLQGLFSRLPHPPLAHLPNVSRPQAEAYWFEEFTRDLSDQSARSWLAREQKTLNGLILYLDAPWETKVVKQHVGTLRHFAFTNEGAEHEAMDDLLKTALVHAADRGVRCLTCKVQASEVAAVHALERNGFLLMDSMLDFVFAGPTVTERTATNKSGAEGIKIRPAADEDLAEVTKIAERAFVKYFGRYHADPRVSAEAAATLYQQWVKSSFAGWADMILVAEMEGRPAGFGIWRKASALEAKHNLGVAHYSLAGIHPDFSGRGLYSALAAEGMARFRSSASHLVGPVHVCNFPVHRALHRLGWKIRGARHSFHKWL